jgi:CheY-like chemotaxis protein
MTPTGFRARMLTPASAESAFEVVGRLAPYDLQTLATNAQNFPLGSRLELTVDDGVSARLLRDVHQRLAGLGPRGIAVVVRRTDASEPADDFDATRKGMDGTMSGLSSAAPRVLVAEDDPDMRRLIATSLRMAGHKVVEATDGMDVLDRMETMIRDLCPDAFDVIVSDVNMPGLSGLDVLAALRCTHWTTPVVLITAFGDEETRAEARELGASAILDKPLDPEALRSAVRDAAQARADRTLAGGYAIA